MNNLELKMVALLKDLKENHAVPELKMEFEAEASRMDEAMRLKEIAERADLGLVVKIGGCEAITDMFNAQLLGASCIIAPMIESSYALKKYIQAIERYFPPDVRKNTVFGFNLETYLAYQNINEILKTNGAEIISTVTLGRVDLVGSMGLTRAEINSERILRMAQSLFTRLKKEGLRTTMGGGISVEAIPFIQKLSAKLLNRFETRKVVFNTPKRFDQKKVKKGILKAVEFELLWLKNKKNYYSTIAHEDGARIKMLEGRLQA